MSERPTISSLVRLWNAAERACLAADRTVPADRDLGIWAGIKGPRHWHAAIDDAPALGRVFERAGVALASLGQALPLVRRKRAGILEYLFANNRHGEFSISVWSLPDEAAFVESLVCAADAVDFAASRQPRTRLRTPWDAACRRRLVRRDPRASACVLEPGVVWFVEWLESKGAQTLYSCEGHPADFHVTFRAPYELAHWLAGVPLAAVAIFRSGAFPQQEQWQLRLNRTPKDRDERDDLLRRLADHIVKRTALERER